MHGRDVPGLDQFLNDYRQMAIKPSAGDNLVLKGNFAFTARSEKHGEITDTFKLQIEVPRLFPKVVPVVRELGSRIPKEADYHINQDDKSFCLGSPLRLLLSLSKEPTLIGFANRCLVPWLFAISHKLAHGGPMPFDELRHGAPGMLADYADLLGLRTTAQARDALQLLGMKKRLANKKPCPCRCGRRLGKCKVNDRLRPFRKIASCSWFKGQFNRVRFISL